MNDIEKITTEQLEQLLVERRAQEAQRIKERKEAYEALKSDLLVRIERKLRAAVAAVESLYGTAKNESIAFYEIMKEYGEVKKEEQVSFDLDNDNFRFRIRGNKVKGFDERADIAAVKLIEFLNKWIGARSKGVDDPMYALAMTMLERNRDGDLDYKSISKLQEMKPRFNSSEYDQIMRLFEESNTVEKTLINFYFFERTDMNKWRKIEPSFNRM